MTFHKNANECSITKINHHYGGSHVTIVLRLIYIALVELSDTTGSPIQTVDAT